MSRKNPPRPQAIQPKEPTRWVGSAQKDFGRMPEDIKDEFLASIKIAERGGKADNAEPMKGFPGGKVIDIKGDYDDNCTYRCVYTIQFPQVIYVLHAFKKKSNQGIATPEADMKTVRVRLKAAKGDSDQRERERRGRETSENNQSSKGTGKRPPARRK